MDPTQSCSIDGGYVGVLGSIVRSHCKCEVTEQVTELSEERNLLYV
jgi:hypothetical protein